MSRYEIIANEVHLLDKNFNCIHINPKWKKNSILTIKGEYSQTGISYKYKVIYDGVHPPEVFITSPKLIENAPHTFKNKSLCLYYWKEQPWRIDMCHIYSHIIPWIHEWILFYEIYLITGEWEHPEVVHEDPKK